LLRGKPEHEKKNAPHGRTPHRRPSLLVAAAATMTVLLAACGGSSADHPLALGTAHADESAGQPVSSLVPASASFRVVFAWTHGAPGGGTGAFVWDQAGGERRWDFSPEGAAKARIGWLSVEGDFDATGNPASSLDCLWEHTSGPNVRVGCDSVRPTRPGADALTRAFAALRVTGRYDDQVVAGRMARCYAFQDTGTTTGQICLDAQNGEPLAFAATGSGRNKAFHVFEATDVGEAASVVSPTDVPLGTVLSPVTRDASVLTLPPEFVVPQ
jgi:hypothetical protein